MSINERALLVKLSVSQWYNRVIDRKVTDEIAQRYEVTKQEDKYVKTLLPRVAVRNIRRDLIEHLRQMHKNKLMSEDDLKRFEQRAEKLTHKYIEEVDKVQSAKDAELMEV